MQDFIHTIVGGALAGLGASSCRLACARGLHGQKDAAAHSELLVEAVIPRLTVDRVLLAILPGMDYLHWFAVSVASCWTIRGCEWGIRAP